MLKNYFSNSSIYGVCYNSIHMAYFFYSMRLIPCAIRKDCKDSLTKEHDDMYEELQDRHNCSTKCSEQSLCSVP